MKIPIGKLAKIVDLSPSALRFYEEKGLICSQRSECGWRYYERAEIIRLLSCKKYATMGFSLKTIETQISLDGENRDTIKTRLENQRSALLKKARELEDMAAIIQAYEYDIANINNMLGNYEIVERSEMHFVCAKNGELISASDEANSLLSKWIKKFPGVRLCTLYSLKTGQNIMGYIADEEYLKKCKLPVISGGILHTVFQSGKYYHTVIKSENLQTAFSVEGAISSVLARMDEISLSPGEYTYSSLILVEKGDNHLETFFDTWIQIKDSCSSKKMV